MVEFYLNYLKNVLNDLSVVFANMIRGSVKRIMMLKTPLSFYTGGHEAA